jgi:hypothetical protein
MSWKQFLARMLNLLLPLLAFSTMKNAASVEAHAVESAASGVAAWSSQATARRVSLTLPSHRTTLLR